MKEDKTNRIKLSVEQCNVAMRLCAAELDYRLNEKGSGTFSSRHEIQGCVTEEYHEAVVALKTNDVEHYKKELLDIAVSCIFGVACIESKTIEW